MVISLTQSILLSLNIFSHRNRKNFILKIQKLLKYRAIPISYYIPDKKNVIFSGTDILFGQKLNLSQ